MNDGAEDNNGSRFCFVQSSSVSADMLLQMKNIGFPSNVILKYAGVGGAPWLDTKQVVFAQVYEGLEVLDAIAAVEVDENGVPKENVIINSMTVKYIKGRFVWNEKAGVWKKRRSLPCFSWGACFFCLFKIKKSGKG